MTQRLLLLGDSIIDNGAYVPGQPDVATQVQTRLPEYKVHKHAIDGSVTRDVLDSQLDGIRPDDFVVLSSGGNDALSGIAILDNTEKVSSEAVMLALWNMREAFRTDYAKLLQTIRATGVKLLVCTIYDPNFDRGGGDQTNMQRAAEAGLGAFNDSIQRIARSNGADVLEIRDLFTSAADFANPIEPSAVGGDKLAAAIAQWVSERAAKPTLRQ